MKLFSAFAAADLLERDRQTITRALRGTPPDGKERGQPRWKMASIVAALEKRESPRRRDGTGYGVRFDNMVDELERLYGELDDAIALIKSLPDMDSKQPHSRAAMQMVQRMEALHNETNEIKAEEDGFSPWSYVTPAIEGTYFRMVLAAIYGPEVEFEGERMFTDEQIDDLGLR